MFKKIKWVPLKTEFTMIDNTTSLGLLELSTRKQIVTRGTPITPPIVRSSTYSMTMPPRPLCEILCMPLNTVQTKFISLYFAG